MSKTKKLSPQTPWSRAALAACDWFVNSQVIQQRPYWDANHGRFCYNVHIATGTRVLGLSWTQGRAIMCLLTAYERTGDEKYLAAARQGASYIRSLQDFDPRHPHICGALHEETPHSPYSYPRDAIEAADGLLQLYRVTKDQDALERALLFFDWFKRNTLTEYPGFGFWVRGAVHFTDDTTEGTRFTKPIGCMMGCGTILAHAYAASGRPWLRTAAVKLADSILRNYHAGQVGPLREQVSGKERMSHHTGADGAIFNDDGGCVSLLNAWKLSGHRKYLDAAVQVAEFYRQYDGPIPIYSGLGAIANQLLEVGRAARTDRYRARAEQLARRCLRLQVKRGDQGVKGAFRGEDEGGKWYWKGAANDDFVTTRVTAYSTLTLFKLDGAAWPRGYSTRF
jgi:uncharacterized protein YyaL (SSP411 family)